MWRFSYSAGFCGAKQVRSSAGADCAALLQAAGGQTTRRWANSILLTLAVGIAYFLAARLSLALLTKPDGVCDSMIERQIDNPSDRSLAPLQPRHNPAFVETDP
jgi:hypothetical protein